MALLFEPLKIKDLELKNRLVMSPMCQYSSIEGFVGDWHQVHYGTRASGGVGLIIVEASAIVPEGRITPSDLGIWKDKHVEGLRHIVSFLHSQQTKAGIQLAHAGRKASYTHPSEGNLQRKVSERGWQPVAPSAIPFEEGCTPPLALDINGIQDVIKAFRNAAMRANNAGFDVVEIHAAHGYLLHQFLSPLSNERTDAYGGSLENRSRLLLEVIEAVQQVWPAQKPLFVRISATDWAENGWDIDEAIQLSATLKLKGVDLIDTSSGGLSQKQNIELKPGYQVGFSERIKKETGIRTGAVGLITSPQQAEEILANGQADLILLARELLRNPYFALSAARELQADVQWPIQYQRAKR